ncbi:MULTISPECIES: STAS domain-containing protein [unclassified Frankia]|uniref:STAS domain-containing protein n=1 Tax=unclassified Frankia TaxID=2632575 RepID=UPI001EF6940C|nr:MULTISPECIES: STAS domain-containing protein [unclassified Frankia]
MTKTLLPVPTPKARRPHRFASRFHTDIYAPADRTIVRAHGEIDRATRTAFRAALTAGLQRPPSLLIVDLAGVSALGTSGLAVLLGVANRAAHAGIPIMIIGARPRVYRRFALTRLVDRLDVHPTPTTRTLIPAADPATDPPISSAQG